MASYYCIKGGINFLQCLDFYSNVILNKQTIAILKGKKRVNFFCMTRNKPQVVYRNTAMKVELARTEVRREVLANVGLMFLEWRYIHTT